MPKIKNGSRFVDRTGKRYGRLTVLRCAGRTNDKHKSVLWKCRCVCGKTKVVVGKYMVRGNTSSCGCLRAEQNLLNGHKNFGVHGHTALKTKTQTYSAWLHMRQRCMNPRDRDYRHYGGRGIKICKRWNVFRNFADDMGVRPAPKHSLDRIDNNKGYFLKNCRWATKSEQVLNRRPFTRSK